MSIDFNSPEVKEALEKAVSEATAGLVAKNQELLGEVKKLKKGQEIKPEQYEALENELDSYKDKLTELQKQAKALSSDTEKYKKLYESESGFTNKLLVENGLQAELVKVGVNNPAHLKAVKSMLSAQVQVKVEGDERKAIIGDKGLTEFISEWAKSDEGKHFVSAPNSTGGGSTGGGNASGGGKSINRTQFGALSPIEQASFVKGGGKVTD